MIRAGRDGFVGIEVKYHEILKDKPAMLRPRYEQVADECKSFKPEARARLRDKPLQQIWRDHLLAESMLLADRTWKSGLFVFLYPRQNRACETAINSYQACLAKQDTFAAWTLEMLANRVSAQGAGEWIEGFSERYLRFERLAVAHKQP